MQKKSLRELPSLCLPNQLILHIDNNFNNDILQDIQQLNFLWEEDL